MGVMLAVLVALCSCAGAMGFVAPSVVVGRVSAAVVTTRERTGEHDMTEREGRKVETAVKVVVSCSLISSVLSLDVGPVCLGLVLRVVSCRVTHDMNECRVHDSDCCSCCSCC